MPASDMDETYDPKNEEDKAMQKEEDKLRKESQRSQRRDAQGKNAGQTEKNMKELEWFLNRSQVSRSCRSSAAAVAPSLV